MKRLGKQEKFVEEITSMNEDFAKWYTDIVKKAELMDYSSVKGCMIIRPYGYAIWENIQRILDQKFKELGHENIALPLFIPENLLQKEKDHVDGFAPEVAWVTHCGDEKLQERLCVRPTSETLFCDHFANIVQSWRDLPKLYNQWCSVVRWEKTTRPFLRSVEFYWQEGHTIHETPNEAQQETEQMLNLYADFFENYLAIPVIKGKKTEKEKFSGAKETLTVEALMYDGKALQSATSHYFGDNFSKVFNIKFQDRNNQISYPYGTSWGLSTRVIGGIIMVHGDDSGLILPPSVAPIQVIIIPIAAHKDGVLSKAREILEKLKGKFRIQIDNSDQSPGWKFSQYEMKGVPLRLEIGPRDIENNQCVLVRRNSREKASTSLTNLEQAIEENLEIVRSDIYKTAKNRLTKMTYTAQNKEELIKFSTKNQGLIKAMWCGDLACEDAIKEETGASFRCIPFEQEHLSDKCVYCGKNAKHMAILGKAY